MMLLGVFIKFINFTCAGVFVINYDFHAGLRHVRKRYVLHTTTPAYTFRVSSPTATSPHPPPTSPHPPPPPPPPTHITAATTSLFNHLCQAQRACSKLCYTSWHWNTHTHAHWNNDKGCVISDELTRPVRHLKHAFINWRNSFWKTGRQSEMTPAPCRVSGQTAKGT